MVANLVSNLADGKGACKLVRAPGTAFLLGRVCAFQRWMEQAFRRALEWVSQWHTELSSQQVRRWSWWLVWALVLHRARAQDTAAELLSQLDAAPLSLLASPPVLLHWNRVYETFVRSTLSSNWLAHPSRNISLSLSIVLQDGMNSNSDFILCDCEWFIN